MGKKEFKLLSVKLERKLATRLDRYRFRRMFPTRTEALEFLLDFALKQNPARDPSHVNDDNE